MKVLHWMITALIMLLGLMHSYIALFCREMSEGTLWFFGSGMAIIFAGLFNLLLLLNNSRSVRRVTLSVNLAVGLLFCMALRVLPEVQVYAGIGLFAIAAVAAVLQGEEKRN